MYMFITSSVNHTHPTLYTHHQHGRAVLTDMLNWERSLDVSVDAARHPSVLTASTAAASLPAPGMLEDGFGRFLRCRTLPHHLRATLGRLRAIVPVRRFRVTGRRGGGAAPATFSYELLRGSG